MSGHAGAGAQLLETWRENISDGSRDHLVIDAWAELLGIAEWYVWLADEGGGSKGSEGQ